MSTKKQNGDPPGEPGPERTTEIVPSPLHQIKRARLLELIGRNAGATLVELTSATGWLPHTTRAAITGLCKRGHVVRRERIDGVSRYMFGSGDQ
jgi:DNA-binding MarR family transcriptional regulator